MTTIGYIYADNKLLPEDRMFLNLAHEAGVRTILFPAAKFMTAERIRALAKKCDVVLNNSAEEESLEIAKTIESADTPVVDPTRSFYFSEDKWMFYTHCRRLGIPTPKTYLLPLALYQCYEPIERMLKLSGAVVIKNIFSSNGNFVDRAKTIKQAIEMIKKFRKGDRAPLIAQEYIKNSHKVYRVTVINGKVVQGVVKKSKNWKCTGRFLTASAPTFVITPKLERMCVKISKVLNLPWCGIDLMRKGQTWVMIEINSSPGMDFVEVETKKLYKALLQYLIDISQQWWKL